MNPQHELRPSERPIRSDYALERSYARRRITTLIILVALIGGVIYLAWGRGPSVPTEIPTIKTEGSYKQKPTDPGGIDIPHQDVRVYDALESKNTPQAPVEHLLPPPETPQEAPHIVPPAPVATPVPVAAVKPSNNDTALSETRIVKTIDTTATPAPVPTAALVPVPAAAPVATVQSAVTAVPEIKTIPTAPKPQALSIEQVIANTKASTMPAPAAKTTIAKGDAAIQLASVPDEAKAQDMMKSLQQKYTAQLGDATLHLARADLGSRGVYYRIQSQSLDENDANQICSALKQINAGCILVRK